MESLQIHLKSFVIKWLNVPPDCKVQYLIKPLRKSIAFAIYRKEEQKTSGSTPKSHKDEKSLAARLEQSNLTPITDFGRLSPDDVFTHQLVPLIPGVYAFVFDNTFSKSNAKKVLFSLYIEQERAKASFTPPLALLAPLGPPPPLGRGRLGLTASAGSDTTAFTLKNAQYIEGYLLKKKRKKHQKAFSKRFFRLNFKQGVLEYRTSSIAAATRGLMHLKHAVVTALPRSRELTIDLGVEIWHLKAQSVVDFEVWLSAFNSVKSAPVVALEARQIDRVTRLQQLIAEAKALALVGQDSALLDKLLAMEAIAETLPKRSASNESLEEAFFDAEEYTVLINQDAGTPEVDERTSIDFPLPTADTLYPLLVVEAPRRRSDMPPMTTTPPLLLQFFRSNVGKDLLSIAMPVAYNEPLTVLQRLAEVLEYTELLDKAISASANERLLLVSAFAISYLSLFRLKERNIRKPFMPLLGETFELVRPEQGFRAVFEKVVHKPPVFCLHAESAGWALQATVTPVNKFWGKSLEIINKGVFKLVFKALGECYEWNQPTTVLRNLIAGEKYIEPTDSIQVHCLTGTRAQVVFKPGGVFSGRSEEVTIKAFEEEVPMPLEARGMWKERLEIVGQGVIWQANPLLADADRKWGFTRYAMELNEATSVEAGMAPTDLRYRPDLRAYEEGRVAEADRLKLVLEGAQRERRGRGEVSEGVYFRKEGGHEGVEGVLTGWALVGGPEGYWARREAGNWEKTVLFEV